ncbi:myotubularin-related protein 14 isoform X2 [Syngnathoides biaculeatus]|uniref:myotubularin-related protein 14 isoform X2 n=1 Tax=Syngnathoides biaculeatus TaxID=300417 RepID=UPI002ADDEEC2|nr:myotubularin-related protein 14 isoform X2 [Syngnathoides biaculeatus]
MAALPSPACGFKATVGSALKSKEIGDLIDLFSRTQYRAKAVSPRMAEIETCSLELFAKDYKYSVIHNSNGEVCGHYPRRIVFLEYECTDVDRDRFESTVQISKLQDLVNRSKLARCRGRFVCPVILYNGKHICRSSTLAGWGELYGRTGYNYIFSGGSDDTLTDSEDLPEDDLPVRNGDSQLFDKVRGHDIKLLRYLSVRYICDLMVENKKVKFGVNVTSSEKADKAQRYADFTLLSVPYPGCEFFKDYKDSDYTAEGLVFNWNQDYVDAPLTIPACLNKTLNIDWAEYQSWDLVEQTQNYLKLLLHIINSDDESGLLVHCISGWDRTPLFVSLLRLSLWADGAVHKSLEASEILYLTIAYDWFMFGHMLPDRLSKGEEIFFFCFNFLKHIISEKFSAIKKDRRKNSQCKDCDFTVEDLCQLKSRDRGSVTSLSSDFSLITEEVGVTSSFTSDTVDLSSQAPLPTWKKRTASSPQMVTWNKQNLLDEQLTHPLSETMPSSSSSSNHSEHVVTHAGSRPLTVPGRRFAADYTWSGSSLSTEYGSWQIVSGCGSIHDHPPFHPPLTSASSGIAVPYDSLLPISFQQEGPNGRMFPLASERQARLEAVRKIFLAAYSSTVGLKSGVSSPSGAITGLLEQFARGVGLRSTNTLV